MTYASARCLVYKCTQHAYRVRSRMYLSAVTYAPSSAHQGQSWATGLRAVAGANVDGMRSNASYPSHIVRNLWWLCIRGSTALLQAPDTDQTLAPTLAVRWGRSK